MLYQKGASLLIVSIVLLGLSLLISVDLERTLLDRKLLNEKQLQLRVFNTAESMLHKTAFSFIGQSIFVDTKGVQTQVSVQQVAANTFRVYVMASSHQVKANITAEYQVNNGHLKQTAWRETAG